MLIYNLAIILLLMMILAPIFLYTFLHLSFSRLSEDKLKSIWGTFYTEFRISSFPASLCYVVFFIRRICISVSMIVLDSYPMIQVYICIGSCVMVLFI